MKIRDYLQTILTPITMIELFIEFTDQIFWEGYAEDLAESNPQRYTAEFTDFLNIYNF